MPLFIISFYLKLKRVKINDLMEESSGHRQACGHEKRETNSQPSYQSIEFSSSSAVAVLSPCSARSIIDVNGIIAAS